MIFNSWSFAVFFPTVILLFFLLPFRFRWVLLLLASYFFYMAWRVEYVALLMSSTLIDYWCGLKMSQKEEKKDRKPYLYISLASNLGLLFSFKYFDFLVSSTNTLFDFATISAQIPLLHLLLPVGISFYTFQTLSYSIDLYHGKIKAEKHLGIFAVFVSFFPQLVAGPIERASHLLPQFRKKYTFNYKRAKFGLQLMAWGFFKKLVIADRIAIVVNEVYSSPNEFSGLSICIASIFFAFQIYCDFSAYSDIAIGASSIMGYDLMKNFNSPYFSKSISEFWRRWHISLSSWFKDYVYIPLGGNRTLKWKWYYNLFITFLISGVWHGANWTFVIWGALHGFYLIAALLFKPLSENLYSKLRLPREGFLYKITHASITFFLVVIAWVFFRANTVGDALTLLKRSISSDFVLQVRDLLWVFKSSLLNPQNINWEYPLKLGNEVLHITFSEFIIAILAILSMETIHFLQSRYSLREQISKFHWTARWFLYYLLIISIVFFGVFDSQSKFIYFQF